MRTLRAAAVLFGLVAPVALIVACGARSGLLEFPERDAALTDDAGQDVQLLDDVVLPGLDVQPLDVVIQLACRDASDTLIYVVTSNLADPVQSNFEILRFDPSSAQFTLIGALACPDDRAPFSMAVDREGNAFVLYYDPATSQPGNIYKVNLNTAACASTSYVSGQFGFVGFGMGFVANQDGGGETLYIANTSPGQLGAIDEDTLALRLVGALPPYVLGAELTGTGDGRLFGFYNPSFVPNSTNDQPTYIGQIDPATAAVIGQAGPFSQIEQGNGWAFAFWGGDFYVFTNPGGPTTGDPTSIVQRFDPTTGSVTQIAQYPQTIVGAGVSTCAPVQ